LLKQNLVLLFVFSSSSSRTISSHICVQNTFPPFCLFLEIINCTAVQLMK
jgi:hypothetical protein